MSKMKHLLRKLHIGGGGGVTGHQRLVDARPVDSGPTVQPSTSSSIESDRAVTDASTSTSGGGGAAVFDFLEEEFQVQLALAISASDPDGDGSAQIDVAKRISLGCTPTTPAPPADPASLVDSLSLRYWSYNVVNYNEKVIEGFYDVHCVSTSSLVQGKMPSIVELQALDNVDYEVVVVNRLVDPKLRELEKRVYIMSLESRFTGDLGFSGLVQKIADVVVQRMGGPVGDAEELSRRWKTRNSELRTSLNSIILPLGCLDVGLSRHRALLFKVLADRVNLPCMLIKGSYYTGTDDGAVDLIKIDDGSELIIDLMGAPGSLIPVEVPSSHILNAGFGVRGFPGLTEATECSGFLPSDRPETLAFPTNLGRFPEIDLLKSEDALFPAVPTNEVTREDMLQCHPDKLVSCLGEDRILLMGGVSSGTVASGHKEETSTRFPIEQQTDVELSRLSDTATEGLVLHNEENKLKVDGTGFDVSFFSPPGMVDKPGRENRIHESSLPSEMDFCELPFKQTTDSDDKKCPQDEMEITSDAEACRQSGTKLIETERSNLVLGEGADWEILWENLQIGERIGIGSYGEVYHAELNGTEVAVKKFLDQDFSGDALMQFKCEIEIMLRLRHPNVVLFMGAVTTPPNLSILTEFLPRGSLYRLLHRPNCPIDEKRRLRMAIDVAKGMNYLHTSLPTIVHRDLKSPNLLVDKNWVVKVCDFGLSRLKHHTFLSSKSTAGTPEWMAPEVLRNEPASEKCDIYSFGVILWELATCQIPWKDLNPMQVVGAVGFQNRRLEMPNHIDPSVARIIQDCWQMEPHLRPSFSQLIYRLRRVQQLHIQKNTL